MASHYTKIIEEESLSGQVLWLTLNSPKGNVLDKTMTEELTRAVEQAKKKSQVKAIVFEGAGPHFSFGASVPEHQAEQVAGMLKGFHQLFYSLIDSEKPLVAVVRGMCLGGGMELAAFCHWVFCSEDAKFGQPEIQLAVFPPVASLLLPYRCGQAVADDLCLTGRTLSAQEALKCKLVNAVVPDPKVQATQFIQEQLLGKSAKALQFATRAVRFDFNQTLREQLPKVEALYLKELMATHDANEGIKAFMEKRPPNYTQA